MSFKNYRPTKNQNPTDKQLSKIAMQVEQFLNQQSSSLFVGLKPLQYRELAIIITEFAEDTYFEIGLWESLEAINQELFGNPLPFSKPEAEEHSDFPFDEYRIAHLLWNTLMVLKGHYIPPSDPDIERIAEAISYFLEEKFERIKGQSSVKRFLSTPNKTGADLKRKLVWAGLKSYLFRNLCSLYLREQEADNLSQQETIAYWDDFICQECTLWSGMGVVEIMANALSLTDAQKEEVRTWRERHFAFYEVMEATRNKLVVKNLLIDKLYHVDDGDLASSPFRTGMIIYGGLVPFKGKWAWSGQQRDLGRPSKSQLAESLSAFRRSGSTIVYRYDKKRLQKAKEQIEDHRNYFIEYHGNDLVVFKTGRAAVTATSNKMVAQQKALLSKEEYKRRAPELEQLRKTMNQQYDADFLNATGVTIFFNPGLGEEMTTYFDDMIAALSKKGVDLNEEDIDTIIDYISEDSISAAMIQRAVKEHGMESIATVYGIPKENRPTYWLDYLLRKYKGKDYQNQYPSLSVMDDEDIEYLKKSQADEQL